MTTIINNSFTCPVPNPNWPAIIQNNILNKNANVKSYFDRGYLFVMNKLSPFLSEESVKMACTALKISFVVAGLAVAGFAVKKGCKSIIQKAQHHISEIKAKKTMLNALNFLILISGLLALVGVTILIQVEILPFVLLLIAAYVELIALMAAAFYIVDVYQIEIKVPSLWQAFVHEIFSKHIDLE